MFVAVAIYFSQFKVRLHNCTRSHKMSSESSSGGGGPSEAEPAQGIYALPDVDDANTDRFTAIARALLDNLHAFVDSGARGNSKLSAGQVEQVKDFCRTLITTLGRGRPIERPPMLKWPEMTRNYLWLIVYTIAANYVVRTPPPTKEESARNIFRDFFTRYPNVQSRKRALGCSKGIFPQWFSTLARQHKTAGYKTAKRKSRTEEMSALRTEAKQLGGEIKRLRSENGKLKRRLACESEELFGDEEESTL